MDLEKQKEVCTKIDEITKDDKKDRTKKNELIGEELKNLKNKSWML